MVDKPKSKARDLENISDEIILDLAVTPRDYLDRTYNSSLRFLEISFSPSGPDNAPHFALDNHTAMKEAQAHIALTHDPINLEIGSVAAAEAMESVSVWHMVRRFMVLSKAAGEPGELQNDDQSTEPDDNN